jgi:DNA-binding NtrC family response regulator
MPNNAISILIVDDEEPYREVLNHLLIAAGYLTTLASDGVEAINILQKKSFDAALLDVQMPRVNGLEVLEFIKDHYLDMQTIMVTAVNDVSIAVKCMQLGAYTYITKPYNTSELLAVVERAVERKKLSLENKVLRQKLERFSLSSKMIGTSEAFVDILNLAARVAPSDSTVLIQGGSGTGKELIANFIHSNSSRADKQFVALNCASIPETLIESELFGHEKGAFTDAISTKQGLVEIASGGTLFLDEVGEISLMVQPKLLRFLQTGEFRRVGSNQTMTSDVRVISATNKDLRQEVAENRFREDLMYRINVITLQLPQLKERKDDIPLLVDYFLKNRNKIRRDISIDPKALELLKKYDWPGNVRELENVIERAAILCQGNIIQVQDIALPIGAREVASVYQPPLDGVQIGAAVSMSDLEKAHISGILKNVDWNKTLAAKILGISLKTLYTKIQQYNLTKI